MKIGKPAALGREPPQNSKDNPDDSGRPVIMRYTWGVCRDIDFVNQILPKDPWIDHVTMPKNWRIVTVDDIQKRIGGGLPYLLIEDYNTTGLKGDITQLDVVEDDDGKMDGKSEENNVLWFLRAIHVSTPRPGRGGSHGIGKMALPSSSRVSTMFVVSCREDTVAQRILCGQTYLKNRNRFGVAYNPEMYFGEDELLDDINDHSWNAITDEDEIEVFCSNFGISRSIDQMGTSIMIPFPDEEVTPESIEMCIIANYALPIAKGEIVFEFSHRSSSSLLDASSIRSRIEELPWGDVKKKVKGQVNAAWSTAGRMTELLNLYEGITEPADERVEFPLGQLPQHSAPSWTHSEVLPDPEDGAVDDCREKLAEGGVIHVVCDSVPVNEKEGTTSKGSFHLVMRRVDDEEDAEAHFYRDHISLPMNLKREPGSSGIASLLVLPKPRENPLALMMRTAEGPAHMFWDTQQHQLEDEYNWGHTTIWLLTKAVEAVMGIINHASSDAEEFLNELFGLGRKDVPVPIPPIPEPYPDRYLDIDPYRQEDQHGYIIRRRSDAPDLSGREYIVRVGYNKPHTDARIPKKAPDSRIIDIRDDVYVIEGAEIEDVVAEDGAVCPDRFRLLVTEPNFRVEIDGLELLLQAKVIATLVQGGEDDG